MAKKRVRALNADDLGKHVTFRPTPNNTNTGRLHTVAHAADWTELNIETRNGNMAIPVRGDRLDSVTIEIDE
ncbi:hypothetical protein KXD96_22780 [Mycobacterium sp. SMC-2]|uniref:hypothetical protein n=1 Tax=Mycobacterium sp. SMC-2 TaxID=2857058 RepID=UPI0021B1C567|nr:hypothetical protein [Mycobacterium sp. SMC-2]UXA05702.1 hypothetical protein KXD96_22780 [Mycobacterium sp. SMC-2]